MTFEMKALDKYSNGTMICVLTGRDFTLTESEGEIPPPDCVVTEAICVLVTCLVSWNKSI